MVISNKLFENVLISLIYQERDLVIIIEFRKRIFHHAKSMQVVTLLFWWDIRQHIGSVHSTPHRFWNPGKSHLLCRHNVGPPHRTSSVTLTWLPSHSCPPVIHPPHNSLQSEDATHLLSVLDGFLQHLKQKPRLVIMIINLRYLGPVCLPTWPHPRLSSRCLSSRHTCLFVS